MQTIRYFLALILLACLAPLARAQEAPPEGAPPGPPPAEAAASEAAATSAAAGAEAPRFVTGTAKAVVPSERTKRQAHIEIDEATRTLIVTTDPATNEQIATVIKSLDKPVAQALIKVLFLEVTHDDSLDLGLDITKTRSTTNADGSVTQTLSSVFGNSAETQGGIATILKSDLDVTLHALATAAKTNVLSRPSVLARNNEEATITVGQEVPFIRNTRVTTDGQTINTIEYQDIGIILTVTPHMGAGGLIELDVAPEISTLSGSTVTISTGVTAPIYAKRSAETHVVVPSGKTVVIGGLMQDQDTVTIKKVPLLGDIPLLGMLFRRKVTTKAKTELLIFLTPTLVEDSVKLTAVSNDERQHSEAIQAEGKSDNMKRYLPPSESGPPPPGKK